MLIHMVSGSKFSFLDLSDVLTQKVFRWLVGFFVLALVMSFASHYLNLPPWTLWIRRYAFQVFVLLAVLHLWSLGWRPLWGRLWTNVRYILGGLVFYFLILEVGNQILGYFYDAHADGLAPSLSLEPLILAAIMAPVLEEMFFRDALFRAVRHQSGRVVFAMVLASTFFMVAHLSLYPGAFLLGLISSVLVLKTSSVIPSIVFHSISNLSWYFLPAWFPNLYGFLAEENGLSYFYR